MSMTLSRKKIAIFLVMVATSLSMISCGNKESGDASLATVIDKGELVLGLDENYPPMGFRDTDGVIKGFDIDCAEEVCKRLGIRLNATPIEWDEKELDLNEGRIDCIWNGMSVNAARKESMNLSEPYIKNDLVFAVLKNSGIKSCEDLAGLAVGVQTGSSAADAIAGSDSIGDISIISAQDNVELVTMLEDGTVSAICLDSIFAYYYISENNKDYFILPDVLAGEDMAIGFRKGDDTLRDKVQSVLSEMKSDGTLCAISDKWFGADVTTVK